jgi:hypothetical protein
MKNLLTQKMKNVDKESYYYKYMMQSYRFEAIGIVLVVVSIITNELLKRANFLPIIILAIIGCVLLVFGGSSSRPANVIRSFAQLLSHAPDSKTAEEFIYALENLKMVSLSLASRNLVNTAVISYSKCSDCNPDVLERLNTAVSTHTKKQVF